MTDDDFSPEPPAPDEDLAMREAEQEALKAARASRKPALRLQSTSREMPASQEAEEHVIATILLDGSDTLERAIRTPIPPEAFFFPANRLLYETCLDLHTKGKPVILETLGEELSSRRQLEAVGGWAYLMQVTSRIPTTAHAGYFIEKLREKYLLREAIKTLTGGVEEAYGFSGGLTEYLSRLQSRIERLQPKAEVKSSRRSPFSFTIPARDDRSILLGNRYLNRGDGIVLSSSSGMGKSSMSQQMAGDWALGRPFHGITSNGALRILIIQSEDSDGDIAEVWQSLAHVNKWSAEDRARIEQNVRIVCEKALRGPAFIRWLDSEAKDFKPDLVILNPLQAYMDGDVTDSRDLGAFLREGLNGINRESNFGYLIVHHTTKPATGKDRAERQWHEVMYDMAGGAEIINWARGIISLRALEDEGKFKVVLAKRGRRAGIVRPVEAGAGVRLEPVTVFGLQHAKGHLPSGTPVIYWEAAEIPVNAEEKKERGGRAPRFQFSDYRYLFPPKTSAGLTLNELHRALLPNGEIKRNVLHKVCVRWAEENEVEIIEVDGQPRRYRRLV